MYVAKIRLTSRERTLSSTFHEADCRMLNVWSSSSMQVKLIICHPTLFSVTSMHGQAGGSGIGDGVGAAAASTPVARKESPEMRRRVSFMVRGHCVLPAHQWDSAA